MKYLVELEEKKYGDQEWEDCEFEEKMLQTILDIENEVKEKGNSSINEDDELNMSMRPISNSFLHNQSKIINQSNTGPFFNVLHVVAMMVCDL